MLCNFYIAALTALLPLYTRGTYVMLGDDKYTLFRSVSLLCLGMGAVAALAGRLLRAAGMRSSAEKNARFGQWKIRAESGGLKAVLSEMRLSAMDVCILLYGLATAVSAMCSSYGSVAWIGYRDWHMGAISQLIFVCIYFFVSRCYQETAWPVYLWEAAFFLVTVLGICSRLGWDPLGLMGDFNSGDWEYSHLISTIGNINWFCGYCAVALVMPVAGYLKEKNFNKRAALYLVSMLGILILCIQGSDVGPVLAIVCLGVCLLWSRQNMDYLRRTLLLTAGVALELPCYGNLVKLLGEPAMKALPADGLDLNVFGWGGWWLVGFACVGVAMLLGRISKARLMERTDGENVDEDLDVNRGTDVSSNLRRSVGTMRWGIVADRLWLAMVILSAIAVLTGGVWYLVRLSGSQDWSSGRGVLWRLSWQGFLQGNWKLKLLGAGPDCFAEYIYSVFPPSELPVVKGYWAEAVFANAHNQWLNHLINTGLIGLFSAVGVFGAALKRYRVYLPGMLALAMYGVNSLVSFQQVMSTPLFFLMLGICECSVRRENKENLSGGKERET